MKKSVNQLPEISELHAILTICREGSITRAARMLGTTQSTLSYMLERMRQRFADPLFVRVGNKMEPTPYARDLADSSERILTLIETEFGQLKHFDPLTSTREFRIVMTEIGAIVLLPALLRYFAQHAPHAKLVPLQPRGMNIEQALASGDADVAIGNYTGLEDHPYLFQQLLFQRGYVCIARENHPEIAGTLSWEQFAQTPQVKSLVSSAAFLEMKAQLERRSLAMNVAMTLEHAMAIPFIVGATNMIALVAQEVFELFQPTAGIRVVKLPVELPQAHICQYWNPSVNRDPAVTFLRKAVYEAGLQ